MKINTGTKNTQKGFTLVEMIGVLAIIATIAGALLPRVFEAVTDSQVNNVAQSVRGLKGAVSEFYADNNAFPANDNALLTAGLIEEPMDSPIGDAPTALTGVSGNAGFYQFLNAGATDEDLAVAEDGITGTNFDLGGNGTATQEVPAGASLVLIQLDGVSAADAQSINDVLDGDSLGADDDSADDAADEYGRVIYDGTGGFPTTVYIYVAHR